MSVSSINAVAPVAAPSAPAKEITLEVAFANFKRLAEFGPNQWPYTMDEAMVVMKDMRYLQGMRGPVCNTEVIQATAKRILILLDSNENSEMIGTVKSLLEPFHRAIENIAASFSRYPKIQEEIAKVKIEVAQATPVPVMVAHSREQAAAGSNKTVPMGVHPQGLTRHVVDFDVSTLHKAEKRSYQAPPSALEKGITARRASMYVQSPLKANFTPVRQSFCPPQGAWAGPVTLAEKLKQL